MTDKIMAIGAYIVLACFLGILVWYVPRPGLVGVVLVTMILATIDIAQVLRSHEQSHLPQAGPDRHL